jgi:hypothetical protein
MKMAGAAGTTSTVLLPVMPLTFTVIVTVPVGVPMGNCALINVGET